MAMFAERGDDRVKLWTMQTRQTWDDLQRTGVFRTDTALCWMAEYFPQAYSWLAREMTKRVGPPPQGVDYPVWAWYMQNGRHKKPDLRSERWGYGPGDEDYCCIELEIAPQRVLLSDFDVWHGVLNNGLISDTEEEDVALEAFHASLSDEEKTAYKEKNWERVFDISPLSNNWTTRGEWVQATFWELRREDVRAVRFFRTGKYKRPPEAR